MLQGPALARTAAALLAAALVITAVSCGGGNETGTPSPSASPGSAGTPNLSPSAQATPGRVDNLGGTLLFTAIGGDSKDMESGPGNLATGDFNGDGAADVIIGAPQADGPDNALADTGEAYVVFGPPKGTLDLGTGHADVVIIGASPGDYLGFSVASGDINGDGTDDVIVGAPGVTAGWDPRTDQGRVYVFFGGKDLKGTFDLAQDVYEFVVTGAEGFSRLGHAIAVGDVNGDDTDDLVLGAPFAGRKPGSPVGSERTGVGEVYVVYGSADVSGEISIPSLQQDVTFSGAGRFAQFGAAVAAADIDGDGLDDVIVGAHQSSRDNGAKLSAGAAYVFRGRRDLSGRLSIVDGAQDVTILGDASTAFGFPIVAGDFNGDNKKDVAIGAQQEGSTNLQSSGAVRIFFGGSDLDGAIDLAQDSADVLIPGAGAGGLLPSSLAAADVDGDGTDDLVIGSILAESADGLPAAGRAYVLLGGPDLPAKIDLGQGPSRLSVSGIDAQDLLGSAVAAADVSGDGKTDLVLMASGADGKDNKRADAGEVYALTPTLP